MPSEEEVKQNIEGIFNDVASRYDSNHFFTLSAENLIAHANPVGNERVLDVCAGTGIVAIAMALRHPGVNIDALDISSEMLNQAKLKAEEQGVGNINYVVSDIDDLSYGSDAFDLITCGYGLFFFPDMEKSFNNILSILKARGKFFFSTFTDQAFQPLTEIFMKDLQRYEVETPSLLVDRLQSTEKLVGLCQRCGVSDVQIETATIRYDITPDDWWDLINSAAYKGLLNQVGDEKQEIFKNEHLEAVYKMTSEGKIELVADSYYAIVEK